MSTQSQEDSIKEGKQRDEILFSFKAIGIAEIVLGILLIIFGILTVIFASMKYYFPVSLSGCGIWGGLCSVPAGVMSISTSNKVTYFSVGWSMLCSIFGSFFSFLICSISFGGAIESGNYGLNEIIFFNIFLFVFGISQLTLCIYSSVVFGRLYWSYPYHLRNQDFLCPCSLMSRNRTNFADVMYSTIASKKHDY